MWQALMETKNFTFTAYGAGRGDAIAMLCVGLDKHAQQYELPDGWYREYEISYRYIARGECYRDNELIKEA